MNFGSDKRMTTGMVVSGVAHLALIAWILFGGVFDRSRDAEFTVSDVSILSEEEFAALSQPNTPAAPEAAEEIEAPETPATPEAPQTPVEDEPTEAPQVSEPEAPAEIDETPDVEEIEPLPQPEIDSEAPVTPELPSPEGTTLDTPVLPDPNPQEAERVAPEAAPEPEPEAEIAEVPQDAVAPDESAEAPAEEQEAAAPEAAATEIVTEAEQSDEQTTSAPLASRRPTARPERPAQVADAPQPAETDEPAQEPDSDPLANAIGDAVAEAVETDAPAQSGPTGPPLTGGEKDALRLAVQQCWNVGSLSSEALRTTVVVGIDMTRDGKPVSSSIRMISSTGGTSGAAQQAYEAARRAVLRCGARGYNLPTDKYDQWQEIEITFNPERMRIK